ncbi:MAG: undecaprenyl-diphosphatase UppP [Myxococcota bacterium]
MNLVEAAVLGLVQGATEYLPVSSSGHLVLVPHLFGWEKAPFVYDVLVQMGTLLGVIVYYWRELVVVASAMWRGLRRRQPFGEREARFGWLVGLATLPAGFAGVLLGDLVESAFSSAKMTMGFLLVTAALLALGERFGKRRRDGDALGTRDAVLIGLAQAGALFPGVSRSGSTIAAGMLLGVDRPGAARFSFLMSIPIMVGAGALASRELLDDPALLAQHGAGIALGFLTAAISGYIVIRWFLGFLRTRSLYWFAAYCALVGVTGLVMESLRGA